MAGGYDIVQTIRTTTEDAGPVKKMTSAGYYAFINAISTTRVTPGGSDFRLMDRKALEAFKKFREHSRFIRGIVGGLGFKQTSIEFEAPARHAGVSKFSMRKMLHFAMDGIITNSTLPLRMAFLHRCPCRCGRCAGDPACTVLCHCRTGCTGLGDDDDPDFHFRQLEPDGSWYCGENTWAAFSRKRRIVLCTGCRMIRLPMPIIFIVKRTIIYNFYAQLKGDFHGRYTFFRK